MRAHLIQQIVHDVIIRMYSHETRDYDTHARDMFVSQARQRLVRLWEDSPEDIRIHPSGASPPPWIFEYLSDNVSPRWSPAN